MRSCEIKSLKGTRIALPRRSFHIVCSLHAQKEQAIEADSRCSSVAATKNAGRPFYLSQRMAHNRRCKLVPIWPTSKVRINES